ARKCRGSLLAMTPSKSKTIARSATSGGGPLAVAHPFAGANRHFQAILLRRQRAFVRDVVVAVGVVGAVEIELVDPLRVAIEIEVAPGGVRLGAVRQVPEHD